MFSMKQKQFIAKEVEKILLAIDHPEMPEEKPHFKLHVDGIAKWSWADVEPNWMFEEGKPMKNNLFNELNDGEGHGK